MIKNLYYHFKLLYFPYWIPIQSFNTITLNASFENTKKIKFIGGVFFFVSLCSVLNDLFRWRNFYNLDQSYFNHTLILLIAPLFSSILFFFKVKTIEEFKKYYKRNLFLTSSYVIFLVFVTAGLGFFEFTTFKKQVAYSIFIVFINYLLLLNRYQRLFFNLSLWLVAILVFSFTAHNQHLYIVELVSISIIIILSGILSHRQYVSWKENMINKEKLNKINTKLELTVAYLNNSKIQLVASNNNLQDFVYAISHDLREPIRISNNLLEIIMIKGRHYITPSELNLLEEVKSNNKMMNSMLEDLLEYSKLGNITSLNNIDLNLVLEKALGLMKNNLEKNQVFITKDTLPTIQCVEVEMLSLFQNLINNSIKY